MRAFKFLHTADIHLGTPFEGLRQLSPLLQQQAQSATFRAFEKIVALAIENQAEFITIAGDLYNSADRSLYAQIFFREQAKRLAAHGIEIFLLHGNHDPLKKNYQNVEWPDSVHVFSAGEVNSFPVIREGEEIARIYGISYPTEAVHENYAARFQREDHAPYAIALLHTNVGGAGSEKHSNYAPAALSELIHKRFQFWGLGHIHLQEVLHPQNPVILYPGNPQGRHCNEDGARGCYLVSVSEAGETAYEFLPTDVIRWHQIEVPISDAASESDLIGHIRETLFRQIDRSGGSSAIIRVTLTGQSALHYELQQEGKIGDLLKAVQLDCGGEHSGIWIESIRLDSHPLLDKRQLRQSGDFVGDFLELSAAAGVDDSFQNDLLKCLQPVFGRQPFQQPTPQQLKRWIEQAEDWVLTNLMEEGAK